MLGLPEDRCAEAVTPSTSSPTRHRCGSRTRTGRGGVYRATFTDGEGEPFTSQAERSFCSRCGSALWLWDPRWPALIHPLASAIDTALPVPAESTHILLESKAPWVVPDVGPKDGCFADYPAESIEDWHKARGLWSD